MQREGAVTRPIIFRADHPFLFLIRDNKTGSILFMGRVMNPQGAAASSKSTGRPPQDPQGSFVLHASSQSPTGAGLIVG